MDMEQREAGSSLGFIQNLAKTRLGQGSGQGANTLEDSGPSVACVSVVEMGRSEKLSGLG